MLTIVVWDLPTRVLHWMLAGSVILALIITGDEGVAYTIHALLGVIALVLVLFRLVWGFVGGEHARFADFLAGWPAVRDYTSQLLRLAPPRHIGHNPLGGWAVILLLGLTLLTAASGALTGGLFGAALAVAAKDVHEAVASLLQFLVFIHVAGVFIDWLLTGDNLVAAMWHGRKRVEDTAAANARGGSAVLAAALAVPLIALGAFVVSRLDLTAAPGEAETDRGFENRSNSESQDGRERD